jgi:hypothetical protein
MMLCHRFANNQFGSWLLVKIPSRARIPTSKNAQFLRVSLLG